MDYHVTTDTNGCYTSADGFTRCATPCCRPRPWHGMCGYHAAHDLEAVTADLLDYLMQRDKLTT